MLPDCEDARNLFAMSFLAITVFSPDSAKSSIDLFTILSKPTGYLICTVSFFERSIPASSKLVIYPSVYARAIFSISSSGSVLIYLKDSVSL